MATVQASSAALTEEDIEKECPRSVKMQLYVCDNLGNEYINPQKFKCFQKKHPGMRLILFINSCHEYKPRWKNWLSFSVIIELEEAPCPAGKGDNRKP